MAGSPFNIPPTSPTGCPGNCANLGRSYFAWRLGAPRLAGLAGLAGLWAMLLSPTQAGAATDPRIVDRYRQMLAANPVEGTTLERLWKIAEAEGTTATLLDEYRLLAAKGDFTGQMVFGLLLNRAGRVEESLAAFRQAAATDPKSPLPHLALAHGEAGAEKAAELEKAAALFPEDAPALPDVRQQLGEAWMAAGQPEKAAQAWEKIVAATPDNINLRRRLAEIYAEKGMNERAAAHYDYLEKQGDTPTRANALRAMARLHQAAGETDAAFDSLEKAIGLMAADNWLRGELVTEMIRTSQRANRVPALEARWKKQAEANPRDTAPLRELAELYEREGNLKAERTTLEKILTLTPDNSEIRIRLGRLLVRLDDLPAATAAFDAALSEQSGSPANADLVFERADLDVRRGDPEAALKRVEEIERAEGSASGHAEAGEAISARALAFYQQHRMFDAVERQLARPGGDPAALAEFLFARHRPREARAALQRLARPGDPPKTRAEAHQRAADLLKQANDFEGAIEEMRAAVALEPDSRSFRLALGDLLLSAGGPENQAAAREAFEKAFALSATDQERVEADQRLFRVFEMGNPDPASARVFPASPGGLASPAKIETTLFSAARLAASVLLSVEPTPEEEMPTPEGLPTPDVAGSAPGVQGAGGGKAALQAFIGSLEADARKSNDPQAWLRLARWRFWNREMEAARTAAKRAAELDAKAAAPRELAVSIALAMGDKNEAIEQLNELVRAAPERKEGWLKQIAQIELQMGKADEALAILEELAKSGDASALTDLANGQQQAEQWYQALSTWQRLYNASKRGRRQEVLQPMVRAMQRLGMNRQAAEALWSAFEEQTEEAPRAAILRDLITQCQNGDREEGSAQAAESPEPTVELPRASETPGAPKIPKIPKAPGTPKTSGKTGPAADLEAHSKPEPKTGTMAWLLKKLEARASASGESADTLALAQALKADGQAEKAYRTLQKAAVAAPDRPAAEGELVREAEAMRDFSEAARHQQLRLRLLPSATAADWEKLAVLQEAALDYAGADETRNSIVRRFPRDSEALLGAARYFEKWGEPDRAREIARAVRRIEPGNLEAAATLCRLGGDSDQSGETREAARAVLAASEGGSGDSASDPGPGVAKPGEAKAGKPRASAPHRTLVLPPVFYPLGNRLRVIFSTLRDSSAGTGTGSRGTEPSVTVFDERFPASTESDLRLEAIRLLAGGLEEPERGAWIARWQERGEKGDQDWGTLSEKLWAFTYSGAHREAFALLLGLAEEAPGSVSRRYALVWSGLRMGVWKELGDWLARPGRSPAEMETFRMAFAEWCALNEPLNLEVLFEKAPLSQLWACAEVLGSHRRPVEAAALGKRAFEAMPASGGTRGANGLTLAGWMLDAGDLPGAKAVLRQIAAEPADSLDAPTYAAQRALFLLLPEQDRDGWVRETLASLRPRPQTGRGSSPLHAALTAALLHTLSGDTRVAHEDLERLVALRAGLPGEGPSVDRVWHFLLATGVQLQLWHLDDAAAFFWERALSDPAAIRLQGERVAAFADEIRMRLAAIRLTQTDASQFRQQLEELAQKSSVANLSQLSVLLEGAGFRTASVRVLDILAKKEPKSSLLRLLAACSAAGDTATAEAAVERWIAAPEDDFGSAPAVLDFIASRDRSRALKLAEELVEKSPNDPRLLEPLARLQVALEKWDAAAQTFRKLIAMQPASAAHQLGLANAMAAQGRRAEAIKLLKTAPRRGPELDAKIVEILMASGGQGEASRRSDEVQARVLAGDLLRVENAGPLLERMAKAFAARANANPGGGAAAREKNDGLALLASAVEIAVRTNKPRMAFDLQKALVELAGPDAAPDLRARWLRRLHLLGAGRPDLTSIYFEFTSDARWQPPADRKRELLESWDDGRGSAVAGAWLIAALLEARQSDAAAGVLPLFLARADIPEPLFGWLDDRCKAANRHDLALAITETALKRFPDAIQYAIRRARSLHALGRDDEASSLLERGEARSVFDANSAASMGPLALASFEIGNTALARELFARAVAADPAARRTDTYLGYARLLMADRDFPAAKRVLRQAFRNPSNTDVRVVADYLLLSGRSEPGRATAELRDLELRPELLPEIERLVRVGAGNGR